MEEYVYEHLYKIEKEHWWFAARQNILMHYIHTRIPLSWDARVLDVGCGAGAILERLSRQYQAYGTDFSPHAVEFCRKRGLTNLHTGHLASYPKDTPFDLITMLDVVEHVDDDRGLLRDARSLLRGGGYLLITVPAFPSLWSDHDIVLHHKRRYTRTSLKRIVVDSGFELEHLTFFNTLLFPLAVTKRWTARLFHVSGANDLEVPQPGVNRVFRTIFSMETRMVPHGSLPFGLSLLCLARKPAR